jgi:hypothetical protein
MNQPFIPSLSRKDLSPLMDPLVIICSARPGQNKEFGVGFLKDKYRWEAVGIEDFKIPAIKYFALYVTRPVSKVQYFAEVSRIVKRSDPEFMRAYELSKPSLKDEGKKAILFKEDSLVELYDPIPAAPGKGGGIQNIKYSTLSNFIKAKNVKDLY